MPDSAYVTPLDPRVACLVARLSPNDRESYEEKAAIRTYLGQLGQARAEVEALLDVLSAQPAQARPVRVFRLTLGDDASQWVFAHDPGAALACLQALGGSDIAEVDLDDVLNQQFGGLAFLATST